MDTPFHPLVGSTVSISATSSNTTTPLTTPPTGKFQLRIFNDGPNTVFINRGTSTVVATTANYPLPAGAVEVITVNNLDTSQVTHVAAICASGKTATVYFTIGAGI